MVLQIKAGTNIENPRGYGAHTIEDLGTLLASGCNARRDPIREHFYELEGTADEYYVHVSPITGNVVLLARWMRQPQESNLEPEQLVA